MTIRQSVRRWLRFIGGGILNTAVTYALYLLLIPFLTYQWAYVLAYGAGIVIAYLFNSILVFRAPVSLGRFATYPLIYIIQYGVAAALLAVCVEYIKLPETTAPLLVIAAMVPLSYGLNRVALRRPASQDVQHGNAPQDP